MSGQYLNRVMRQYPDRVMLLVPLSLRMPPRQFRVRVRDDGRGIEPRILEEGGRPGHWGMHRMRELPTKIGAQLKLWSRPETGTEVELLVPGATAYRALGTKSIGSWFRRLAGIDSEEL